MSEESKEKMRNSALKRDNTNRIAALPRNVKHWNWSHKPSTLALHKRIHRKYGPAKNKKCSKGCGKNAKDWALIGKQYSDKLEDYTPLCRKCHIALDNHPSKVDRSRHKIIRDSKGRIKTTIVI